MLKHKTQGFTLIETMICIFFMSVGLLAITRMQVGSIRGNKQAMDAMTANLLTTSAADNLSSRNYSDPMLTVADGAVQTYAVSGLYTTQYTVNKVTVSSLDSYLSIHVTTTWSEFWMDHEIEQTVIKLNNY